MLSGMDLRLIEDPVPRDGAENLATDIQLLDKAADAPGTALTLRFYRWRPTLSLGHFQRETSIPAGFSNHDGSPAIVRRPSGGGAIVHDDEWTYSLVLPPDIDGRRRMPVTETGGAAESAMEWVWRLHRATAEMLQREYGVDARLAAEIVPVDEFPSQPDGAEPFLCFERRAPEDVVVADEMRRYVKILGSAMRLRRAAILLHGSLLVRRSRHAPQLPGLADLLPRLDTAPPNFDRQLLAHWRDAIMGNPGRTVPVSMM